MSNQNFVAPTLDISEGAYLKFEEGDNRFRIVSPVIAGYEGWNRSADTPKVFRQETKFTGSQTKEHGFEDGKQKQFFGFIAWDYRGERWTTVSISQASLRKGLHSYFTDAEYGDPSKYDIVVKRSGSGIGTEYQVMAKPPKKFVAADPSDLEYKLEELFIGGDPLNPEE